MSTIAGVLEELQEEKPLMTREELLGSNHRQNLIKDFRQAKMDKHADFLFQSCLEKQAKERATPILQKQEVDATLLDGWCQRQPSASSRRRATVAHRRRQRSMSNRAAEYEKRVQLHTALQSAVYCKQTLAVAKDTGHFGTEEDQRASASNMAARTLQYMQRARGRRERHFCCNII